MSKRATTYCVLISVAAAGVFVWSLGSSPLQSRLGMPADGTKIVKSDSEWRQLLNEQQYHVTRRKGTEPAFSGEFWNRKDAGIYACICCAQEIFDSKTKYDSGTGWPSFWQPIDMNSISLLDDRSDLMIRTEVLCSKCDAHLGHVFGDGPPPSGQRYCINSAALRFNARGKHTEE